MNADEHTNQMTVSIEPTTAAAETPPQAGAPETQPTPEVAPAPQTAPTSDVAAARQAPPVADPADVTPADGKATGGKSAAGKAAANVPASADVPAPATAAAPAEAAPPTNGAGPAGSTQVAGQAAVPVGSVATDEVTADGAGEPTTIVAAAVVPAGPTAPAPETTPGGRPGGDGERPSQQGERRPDQLQRQQGGKGKGRRGRDRDKQRGGGEQREPREPREQRDDRPSIPCTGILDVLPDGFGFLRTSGFTQGDHDVYVSLSQIRRFGLRRGDEIQGQVREPKDNEKYNALLKIDAVNGIDPETARKRPMFEQLTPLFPDERLRLETEDHDTAARIMDLLCPIGKGQRGLIVSPPKAGKTTILKKLANSIATNNPDVSLFVLLVDERPEEVTDMQRSVLGTVVSSTFDQPSENHVQVTELVLDRVKRLVEMGKDVVVLLDSITRMARAFNLNTPASGRILSGGVDSTALYPPKKLLRRGPQYRGGWIAHHPRHGAHRHRFAHGRGDLRGVQGHRQYGDPPRPAARRQAHLPGHRHRDDGHPQGGAAHGAGGGRRRVEAPRRAAQPRPLGRHRVAHQEDTRDQEQRRVPQRAAEELTIASAGGSRAGFSWPPRV